MFVWFSSLFYSSIWLFFHQYHTAFIIIAASVLQFHSLLYLKYCIFRSCLYKTLESVIIHKITCWDFYFICIESIDQIGKDWHCDTIKFLSMNMEYLLFILWFHLSWLHNFPHIDIIHIFIMYRSFFLLALGLSLFYSLSSWGGSIVESFHFF